MNLWKLFSHSTKQLLGIISIIFLLSFFSLPLYAQTLEKQLIDIQAEIVKIKQKRENMIRKDKFRLYKLNRKLIKLEKAEKAETAKKDVIIEKENEKQAEENEKQRKLDVIKQMLSNK